MQTKLKRCTVSASLSLLCILTAAAFTAKEVTVHNPASGLNLAGTLTLPDSGQVKAVIVTADNLTLIKELCPTAETVETPSLNHLMLKCIAGTVDEYPRLSGDIDESVLTTIAAWLDSVTAQSR